MPRYITVREARIYIKQPGFRTKEIIIVTTLIDPIKYTKEDLANLYLKRWNNEVLFKELRNSLERKKELIHNVYPELAQFLEEDAHRILGWNLDVTRDRVVREVGNHLGPARRVVEGEPFKSDGTRYRREFIHRIWSSLAQLNENPRWVHPLVERETSKCKKLFRAPTVTTTGRIRNYASYCDWRNTRFQE